MTGQNGLWLFSLGVINLIPKQLSLFCTAASVFFAIQSFETVICNPFSQKADLRQILQGCKKKTFCVIRIGGYWIAASLRNFSETRYLPMSLEVV